MRTKKLSPNIVIFAAAALIDVALIVFLGLTALCEITILPVCEAVVFVENVSHKKAPGAVIPDTPDVADEAPADSFGQNLSSSFRVLSKKTLPPQESLQGQYLYFI